ncbi:bile acid:sodium symporter family protein [Schinkia sp. CFF1]
MLQLLNKILLKFMPVMTPISVVIGIVFSDSLTPFVFLVPWLFAFMTFSGSLNSNFADIKSVIRYPKPLFVCLAMLHIIMPLIALGVGHIAYRNDPYTIIGLVLAFLIPTGVSSLVWVSIYKGNIIFTLAIIVIDSLLSPFIVPAVLHVFFGKTVHMNGSEIMQGLIWMIVLPSILGMLLNESSKGKIGKILSPKLAPFSKLCLGAVVGLNGAAIAPHFKEVNSQLLILVATVFSLACLGYIVSWFIAKKLFKEDSSIQIALIYNSGMRNISAGAVIAITYFPAPVAIPVIIGMLFQQILASFTGTILSRHYHEPVKEVSAS